jgi:Ca2+-binding EF-hand superfamily protein
MHRLAVLAAALLLTGAGHAQVQPDPKKLPPELAELLKLDADAFLKKYDKNRDGFVTKEELPDFLAKNFERSDRNGDGKLDRTEITALLNTLRVMLTPPPEVEKIVEKLLAAFDTDKDGKISKAEARGKVADNFAAFDLNKDGFLDRGELRVVAAQFLAAGGKKKDFPAALDFDSLDRNADGRLSRAELKGTPFEKVFDQIDTNRDGLIDRDEFEAYLKKVEKK